MNTTAAIPTACNIPLWHGDQVIGLITVEACDHGTMIGTFKPGPAFDVDRRLFEDAISAEEAITKATRHEYHAAWHAWKEACERLQKLDLSYGDLHIPIEGFAIDADGRVEFETALWWDVMLHPKHRATNSGSRWRSMQQVKCRGTDDTDSEADRPKQEFRKI